MGDWKDIVFDVIKFLVPSLVIFGVTYLIIKNFFDAEEQKRNAEYRLKAQSAVIPVRLQAYERLTLLLERINPANSLMRVNHSGITAAQLKATLINDLHNEFNHNLSQQVYISPQAWSVIRVVKEQVINIINTAYTTMDENSKAIELSKKIFEIMDEYDDIPTQKALDFLKKEVSLMFD